MSAKAICRFISKHHSHHGETAEDPEQQEPEANPSRRIAAKSKLWPDTKEEEADAGLLDDFFAAASAMCEDESDDEGPEGIMTSASGHAPCSGGDDGSSSSGSSSSSSSDSSSTSSDPKGKAKAKANPQHRELQTLQEAGGRSASAHDPSTVSIGPLKIVKRFYPVPCCSNWSSLRVYSVSSSSLMPSL